MSRSQKKGRCPRKVLQIPDLEQSKHAVLHSLPAIASQESYGHAIDESITSYCSEPRRAFNCTVVPRYRFFLEQWHVVSDDRPCRHAGKCRLQRIAAAHSRLSPPPVYDIDRQSTYRPPSPGTPRAGNGRRLVGLQAGAVGRLL